MKKMSLPIFGFVLLALICLRVDSVRADGDEIGELVAILSREGSDNETLFTKVDACKRLNSMGDESAISVLIQLLGDYRLDTDAKTALRCISRRDGGRLATKVSESLREVLNSSDERKSINVVGLLGELGDEASVPIIAKIIQTDDQRLVNTAIIALARIGNDESVTVLLSLLESSDKSVRLAAVDAVLTVCDKYLCDETTENNAGIIICAEAIQRLEDLPTRYSAATYRALILASGEQGVKKLLELLHNKNEYMFLAALGIAREVKDANFVAWYSAELENLIPARQPQALSVLCDRSDVNPLPDTVLALAQNGSAANRRVAIAVMAVMAVHGGGNCVPVLLESLGSDAAEVADAAKKTLGVLKGNEIDAAIVKQLGSDNPGMVDAALALIGERRIASATRSVFALTKSKHAAIKTLGQIANFETLPEMIQSLDRAKGEDEKTLWSDSLKTAVARMPDSARCASVLKSGLTETSVETKCAIIALLPSVGGDTALQFLEEQAISDTMPIRDSTTKALGEWMSPEVASVLLRVTKMLKDKKDEKLHVRTLRGLIRALRQFDMPRDDRLKIAGEALMLSDRNDEQEMLKAIIQRWSKNPVDIFDGTTFEGWNGDTEKSFRIENGAIIGGNFNESIPRNEFLTTQKSYRNFILTLECKALGEGCNGGIQIRSQRVPNHHEMSGYQADIDQSGAIWGNLYDESRRNRNLAETNPDELFEVFKKDDWNHYEIRCEGRRIQLFVNGLKTVDYTEDDEAIPQEGLIGLQIHGGPPSEVWYRNIRIQEF